ncbi:MAG: F0F1-type ATP synthase assembly protein I [Bradymonadia bacterium]
MTDNNETEEPQTHAEKMHAARASAIGLQFAISIGIGAFAGNWLDGRFDTGPWLLMTGVLLGSAAGFRDLYRLAKSQTDDEGEE